MIAAPDPSEVDQWLDAIPAGDARMDAAMQSAVGYPETLAHRMATESAHDVMTAKVYRVIASAAEGHPGAYRALSHVQRAFLEEMMRRESAGMPGRDAQAALLEFQRAAVGAAERIAREKRRS